MASNFSNFGSYYGGGCGCGTPVASMESNFVSEPFEDYNYYEDFEQDEAPQTVQTQDPVSGLFSKFFESPLQSSVANSAVAPASISPVVSTISQKLQLDPQYLQSMISQVSAQFGIHPAELRENIAHFFSRFGINPNAVRSTITEIANQVGLKNKLGLAGPINPETVKQALSSVDLSQVDVAKLKQKATNYAQARINPEQIGSQISQINPETVHQIGQKLAQYGDSVSQSELGQKHGLQGHKLKHVGEKLQGVSQSDLAKVGQIAQNRLQKRVHLKQNTNIEVPQIKNTVTGANEPVVLRNGKLVNGVSGVPVVINPANGQLVNPVDGQPAHVNGNAVVVNSQGELVNATTGNSVTVPVQNIAQPETVINQFANANMNSANTAIAENEYNPNSSNVSWSNLGLTNNNQKRIKNYITSKYPNVDVSSISPTNVQRQLDDFLAQYTQE